MSNIPHRAAPELKFGATSIFGDVPAVLEFYGRVFGLRTRFYDPEYEYGELLAFGPHRLGGYGTGVRC